LAVPVQLLRNFRDKQVASTFAGSQFLKAFDAFYYSFSPAVARCLTDSPLLRESARMLLYPTIRFLHLSSEIYSALCFCPEVAVAVSGLVASFLIGLVYLGPLAAVTIFLKLAVQTRKSVRPHSLQFSGAGGHSRYGWPKEFFEDLKESLDKSRDGNPRGGP